VVELADLAFIPVVLVSRSEPVKADDPVVFRHSKDLVLTAAARFTMTDHTRVFLFNLYFRIHASRVEVQELKFFDVLGLRNVETNAFDDAGLKDASGVVLCVIFWQSRHKDRRQDAFSKLELQHRETAALSLEAYLLDDEVIEGEVLVVDRKLNDVFLGWPVEAVTAIQLDLVLVRVWILRVIVWREQGRHNLVLDHVFGAFLEVL
jgi:hypothetical protein